MMKTIGIYDKSFAAPSNVLGASLRAATRSEGGDDAASFSGQSLAKLNNQIAKGDRFTSSSVYTTLNDGSGNETSIIFDNKTGAVTWNGNRLNLTGFANALQDDLAIKNKDGFIEVYNLSTGKKLKLNADGTQIKVDGKLDPESITEDNTPANDLSIALFINNRGKAAATGDQNDVIINRQASAKINAGDGDDKIFNFASTASKLEGGDGNDSIYSVGLSLSATVDVSGGNGYVKLIGGMAGGQINLGKGVNLVDASGQTLRGVEISDAAGAESSAVIAASLTSRSKVTLNAAQAAVDVKLLSSSDIAFGTGANSLVADKITGAKTEKSNISSKGINTYKLGAVNFAKIDSSEAQSDAIKITRAVSDTAINLSKGDNLLDATGQTLTAVQITSAQGGSGSTAIIAGSLAGRNNTDQASSIVLAGSTAGNTVSIAKTVKYANIDTGDGAGEVYTGAVNSAYIRMGGEGSSANQTLTVNGVAAGLTYKGSKGKDELTIMGAVSNSNIDLGEGDNSLTARNAKDATQTFSNTNISAAGNGATNLDIGGFVYGATGNAINLGAGENVINMGGISGKGTKGLSISFNDSEKAQSLNVNGSANYLNYHGSKGNDEINIAGGVNSSNIDLGTGDNSFTARNAKDVAQKVTNTNITASGSGSNTLTMGAYVYSATGNTFDLGASSNEINMGSISGKGTYGLSIIADAGEKTQTLNVNGSANYLNYHGSKGADELNILGAVSNSQIDLGEGDNSFTARSAKDVAQRVSNTNITASGSGSTSLDMGAFVYGAAGNAINLSAGENTVNMGSISGKGTYGLSIIADASAKDQTVTINGSANYLKYQGSKGDDELNILGAVSNSQIDLGEGDNSFTARNAKDVAQRVSNTNITASGSGSTSLDMGAFVYGATGNAINLSNGENTVNMGSISGKGTYGLSIIADASAKGQTVTINGSANYLKYQGSKGNDDVSIAGGVSNSNIDLGTGDNSFTARNANGTLQKVSNTNISASGSGSNTLNMGAYVYGAAGNAFNLDASSNEINMGSISGKGTSGLSIVRDADAEGQILNVNGSANYLKYYGSKGADELNIFGAVSNSQIDLGEGGNSFTARNAKGAAQKVSNTNLFASGDSSTSVDMGSFVYGTAGNVFSLGAGSNTINMGSVSGKGTYGLSIVIEAGAAQQELNVNGSANYLKYTGSSGADTVNVSGGISNSSFNLGEGDNEFNAVKAKTYVTNTAIVATGAGSNTINIYNLNTGKTGYSGIVLGDGDDTVNILNAMSGNSVVDMGGGSYNDFSAKSITGTSTTNRAAVLSSGGGTFTVKTGSKALFDFSQSSEAVTLNINSSLADSGVKLGTGSSYIGPDGETGSKADISGTLISGGGGAVTINAGKLTSSTINMDSTNAETTSSLDMTLTGLMKSTLVTLGSGASSINATAGMTSASIVRSHAGSLVLESGNVQNSLIELSGEGEDNINVTGNLHARIILGAGADTVSATGTISGELTADGDLTVNADALGSEVTLKGGNTVINADLSGASIKLGSGDTTIGTGETDIDNSKISGGTGRLSVNAKNMATSSLLQSEATGGLDFTLSGNLSDSTLDLGVGAGALTVADAISNSTIKSTHAGSLTLSAGSVKNGVITLSGEGEDTLNINGDLDAKITLGGGADVINVSGALSGSLKTEADLTLNAEKISGGNLDLGGANNLLNVSNAIDNSSISLGDGAATVGTANTNYSHTTIRGGDADNVINGNNYTGGSITLGDGDNHINVSGALAAAVNLGAGANTIGTETTSLNGFSFTGAGSNTITGKELVNATVHLGAEGQLNQLLVSGVVSNSQITLGGGEVSVGSSTAALQNTTISGTHSGHNVIEAASMSGGSVNLGESDDTLEIYGNIANATINLGAGKNTLRNTLTVAEAGQGPGQGSATANTVTGSTITLGGGTNVYLGDVRDGSLINGEGANNINAASLGGKVDATGMSNGNYIAVGSMRGTIAAGEGGIINVNELTRGSIVDESGGNAITVGKLGELGSISTGAPIHSTTIRINELDGTLDLANANYGGLKKGNLVITSDSDPATFAGSVNIGGQSATSAGTGTASAVDTSGFGLGAGQVIS